jgi:heptosyltransferase-2
MNIVVRTPNWMGDILFSLPALNSLRANFPDAGTWLAGPDWMPALLSGTTWAGQTISLPSGWFSRKAAVRAVRPRRFDIAVLLTNSFSSAWLMAAAKIPQRWGYGRDARGALLTKRVKPPAADPAPHMVRYYLGLLEALGLKTLPPEIRLSAGEEERASARLSLASRGLDLRRKIAVLVPGAAFGPAKRWPGTRFAELARLLRDRAGAEVVIVGTKEDRGLVQDVPAGSAAGALSLAGETNLAELRALMSLASVVVSNDTGPMHLANALRVPVIGIFGPTDPRVTAPFHAPAVILKKDDVACWPCLYRTCPFDHRCMIRITADEVFDAAASYLK